MWSLRCNCVVYCAIIQFCPDLFLQVQAQLAAVSELLKAVDKRGALLEEKREYEAIISNPDRLLAKGSSAA